MERQEHIGKNKATGSSYSYRRKIGYGFAGIVFLVLVILLFVNILLIHDMTVKQTETVGHNQILGITRDLQAMLSESEYMVSMLAANVEEDFYKDSYKDSYEEIEVFFEEQSALQNRLSDGNCINAFFVCDDYIIIPGYDLPDDFDVEERIWYKETLKKNPGETYISPPYIDLVTDELCFTVSKLLSDRRTMVAMDFNLARIQESVEELERERKGEALIVNADGLIVGYADDSHIGKSLKESLPEYADVFETVRGMSGDALSFDSRIGGKRSKVFYNCTQNGWYLILGVQEWELHKESYIQLIRNTFLNLLLLAIVIVLYIQAQRNRTRAENALSAKEKFLSGLSTQLRRPLKQILRSSRPESLELSVDIHSIMDDIRRATVSLSDMMDELFSYSGLVLIPDKQGKKTRRFGKSGKSGKSDKSDKIDMESRIGKRIRWQAIGVLVIAMAFIMYFCARMILDLGESRMSKEASDYNAQLSTWMEDGKTIMDMFAYSLASQPELLDDREEAEAFLDNIARKYPEISLVSFGNPDMEWKVIMNNGWTPDETYILQAYPWYADTMSEQESDGFHISKPYYDTQEQVYCLTFSKRVYRQDGSFLGVLAVDFYLDRLIDVLEEAYTTDGYAFLTSDNGIIINHPNEGYQLSDSNSVNVDNLVYQEVCREHSAIQILKDYDGAYKVCMSEHDDFSNFTIVVVKNWWPVYGGIIVYETIFFLLFAFCISAVAYLLRKLTVWQQEVNVRLQKSVDAAVQAAQAKSQFLAQMSHEIRTPINAVLGMDEMILRENEDEDIREYAENIQGAGRTLLSLINSILDFSKIEEGKMEIVPVQYDVASLIIDLKNMIIDKAEKKDLLLEMQIDEQIPRTLYGDDVRVRQVIVNLLTNAVKYTEKGRVTLVIKELAKEASGGQEGEEVTLRVEVIDTGMGIREEDMEKLFMSFQRLDEEKNRNIEGTGLGISIVQSLLKLMGSSLQVESEYGKGSRFFFELTQKVVDDTPIGNDLARREDSRANKNADSYLYAPDAKILVVDDNQMNLKVAAGLLKRSQVKLDLAAGGMECISLVEKNQYHIIFLDHMMPEMDGIETLKALKSSNFLAEDTKIIVMTANAIAGAKEEYLAVGFDDYVSKPIAVDRLEEVLAVYLPKGMCSYQKQEKSKEKSRQEEAAPAADEFTQAELADIYAKIPQLNTLMGLAFCMNSRMFYTSMLQEFASGKKDEELTAFLENGDLDNYRITVHALKGNARSIGAQELSEEALALEMAAKEQRMEDVTAGHPALVEHYKAVQEKIREVFNLL